MANSASEVRFSELEHETKHSRIQVVLDLDGGSRRDIATGLGIFDHFLSQFAFYAGIDLGLKAESDLHIDDFHLVQDVGCALGLALVESLGNSTAIEKSGVGHGVSGESLVMAAIEVQSKSFLGFDLDFRSDRVGLLATQSVPEFFRGFASASGSSLHLRYLAGQNDHLLIESAFKGTGIALAQACRRNDHHRSPKSIRNNA